MGTSSAVGSYADGVLGCTTDAGQITLIAGWNWYAGSDATQIGSTQYDFETVVIHELGHALGLGHSASATSVMFATLAAGTANRGIAPADLNVPDTDGGVCGLHAASPQVAAPSLGAWVEVRNAPAGPEGIGSRFISQGLDPSSAERGDAAAVAAPGFAASASAGPHAGTPAALTDGFPLRDLLRFGTPAGIPQNSAPVRLSEHPVGLPSGPFGSTEPGRPPSGSAGDLEVHSGTSGAPEVPSLPGDPLGVEELSLDLLDRLFQEEVLSPGEGAGRLPDVDRQSVSDPVTTPLASGWLYAGVAPAAGLRNLAELDAVWASTDAAWESHEKGPQAPAGVGGLAVALLGAYRLSPSHEPETRRRSRRGLPGVEDRE
jgi:hypothetical protein